MEDSLDCGKGHDWEDKSGQEKQLTREGIIGREGLMSMSTDGLLGKEGKMGGEEMLISEELLSSDPCSLELPMEEGDLGLGEHHGWEELSGWDGASLLHLEPVPISLIPQTYFENPLPDVIRAEINKTADAATVGKTGKKIKINHAKKKSDQPKSNKNQGLKDEQAKIATEFRENITVKITLEGMKFFQCKLCEGNIHILYIRYCLA